MKSIKNHDLVKTFVELKGNPKISLVTEPLWFIPFSLFSPFASLYMANNGITSSEIGLIISISLVLQVLFAFVGGVITDKMGRRLTTFIFDFLAWTIPCFIWAFAQNFWMFLLAASVNALFQITSTSWTCLFVEDCPKKHLTNAFTLLHMCGMLSVFFSPIAIVLVDTYSVKQVVSVLYFISGVSMSLKFIFLYFLGGETEMGKIRYEETKNISYFTLFKGYGEVIKTIFQSSSMKFVILLLALTNTSVIATTNFFSLYITEHLHLSASLVPIFPMVRTALMLLVVSFLQNIINRIRMKNALLIGTLVYIISHAVLIVTPVQSIIGVIIYTILEAAAYAIVFPRREALMAYYIIPKERSRVQSIFHAAMIALSSPFGYVVGRLFDENPDYPFWFNIAVFIIMAFLIARSKSIVSYDKEIRGES